MNCPRCQDTLWVCEDHSDKPHGHDDCYGAGVPCPMCNPASRGNVPVLPPDFEIDGAAGDNVINLMHRITRKRWHK